MTCYGKLEKVGKTSISILLRVTTESWKNSDLKEVTNGKFIYVAIDSAGKPRQLPESRINKLYTIIHVKFDWVGRII